MNKTFFIAVIVAVVFGGAGFYGGTLYSGSKKTVALSDAGRPDIAKSNQAGAAGGVAYGEIVSVDDTGMTVKLSDGGSKIILFSDSAKITKNDDAQKSDLVSGQTVMASGSANSDGSITAKTIEINPQTRVNMQSGKSNSESTTTGETKNQDSDSNFGDMGGMPPMDDNGAGGPPPGM